VRTTSIGLLLLVLVLLADLVLGFAVPSDTATGTNKLLFLGLGQIET